MSLKGVLWQLHVEQHWEFSLEQAGIKTPAWTGSLVMLAMESHILLSPAVRPRLPHWSANLYTQKGRLRLCLIQQVRLVFEILMYGFRELLCFSDGHPSIDILNFTIQKGLKLLIKAWVKMSGIKLDNAIEKILRRAWDLGGLLGNCLACKKPWVWSSSQQERQADQKFRVIQYIES